MELNQSRQITVIDAAIGIHGRDERHYAAREHLCFPLILEAAMVLGASEGRNLWPQSGAAKMAT